MSPLDVLLVLAATVVPYGLVRKSAAGERNQAAPFVAAAGGALLASGFVPWVTVGDYAWELQGGFTVVVGQFSSGGSFVGSFNSTVLQSTTGVALLVLGATGHDRALLVGTAVAAVPVLAAVGDLVGVLGTGVVDDVQVLRLAGNQVQSRLFDDVTITPDVGLIASVGAGVPLAAASYRARSR